MKAIFKITSAMLDGMRIDLARSHTHAYERVGFLTAGGAWCGRDELLLLGRDYRPVDDEDYVETDAVGAQIDVKAMRKGVEMAYRTSGALFHVHSHGGYGLPRFSGIDIRSAHSFVPSFFNLVPQMPHGLIVLSEDSADGLVWLDPTSAPTKIGRFVSVGSRVRRMGRQS